MCVPNAPQPITAADEASKRCCPSVPSLMKALRHTVTRAEAAVSLTQFGPAVIAPLLAVLARESDDNIRYHVKDTLAKVGWRSGRV